MTITFDRKHTVLGEQVVQIRRDAEAIGYLFKEPEMTEWAAAGIAEDLAILTSQAELRWYEAVCDSVNGTLAQAKKAVRQLYAEAAKVDGASKSVS